MERYREINFSYKKYILIPLGIGLTIFLIIGGVFLFSMGGSKTSKYNKAVNLYTAGNYEEAAAQFEKLGDYRDSKKRAAEALTVMHYTNGKLAFANGEFDKAEEEYKAAGDYENAAALGQEAARASHYAKGQAFGSSGEYDKGIEEFKKSEYKDYKDKIYDLYVAKGDKEIGEKQFDKALESCKAATTFKDTKEPVLKCYYAMGEDAESNKDLKQAGEYYAKAEDYKDASDRMKAAYYTLGTDALGKNDFSNAAEYLRLAGDYKDAKSIAKDAFYNKGVQLMNSKDYENAAVYFNLAGDYKDSKTKFNESKYTQGLNALAAGKYKEAGEYFDACGKYKYAKDLLNASAAEILLADKKYSDAASLYSKVSKKAKAGGFNVQGRRSFAINLNAFERASGTYFVSSNDVTVSKIITMGMFRARKTYFYVGTIPSQGVVIRYSVNSDGTFNMTGRVGWMRFTKFSADQSKLKSGIVYSDFEFSHIKKMPTSFKVKGGARMKYKNGTFTLTYKKTKSKAKFKSIIKYRLF